MKIFWIFLCLAVLFVQDGYGIVCYHCHQTSKKCNNGDLDDVHQRNCSEDRCALIKYETIMPGRKVLATIRDCATYTEHELLKMVSQDAKRPAKLIAFEECETHLCNLSNKRQIFSLHMMVVAILSLLLV